MPGIQAAECIEQIKNPPLRVPMQVFHDRGTHEATINATLDEITTLQPTRASRDPKGHMDSPSYAMVLPFSPNSAFISAKKLRLS